MSKISLFMMGTLLFVGCSKSTVVLLDNGKVHNAVIVSTDKGSQKLDKVGASVALNDKDAKPSEVEEMSKEEIASRFGDVLAAAPHKALSYLLYFKPHSTELVEASKKTLKEALASIKREAPCMVDIIGHTDTVGSNAINMKVSKKRAMVVKERIEKENLKEVTLVAKGYGEEDLLVETPDNTDEAKNRNVEIFIK